MAAPSYEIRYDKEADVWIYAVTTPGCAPSEYIYFASRSEYVGHNGIEKCYHFKHARAVINDTTYDFVAAPDTDQLDECSEKNHGIMFAIYRMYILPQLRNTDIYYYPKSVWRVISFKK